MSTLDADDVIALDQALEHVSETCLELRQHLRTDPADLNDGMSGWKQNFADIRAELQLHMSVAGELCDRIVPNPDMDTISQLDEGPNTVTEEARASASGVVRDPPHTVTPYLRRKGDEARNTKRNIVILERVLRVLQKKLLTTLATPSKRAQKDSMVMQLKHDIDQVQGAIEKQKQMLASGQDGYAVDQRKVQTDVKPETRASRLFDDISPIRRPNQGVFASLDEEYYLFKNEPKPQRHKRGDSEADVSQDSPLTSKDFLAAGM
jgi:hypothetical protein